MQREILLLENERLKIECLILSQQLQEITHALAQNEKKSKSCGLSIIASFRFSIKVIYYQRV